MEMSAGASTLQLEVRHTHRTWYASVVLFVIAAAIAIVMLFANTGSNGSRGAGNSSTHRAPAVTQVGGSGTYQFKPLP
jgi:hypothetical protein